MSTNTPETSQGESIIRVARKDVTCAYCDEPILKGSQCEYAGKGFGIRKHIGCTKPERSTPPFMCILSFPGGRPRKRVKLYGVWNGLLLRCYYPKQQNYRWYGALGIRVCDEWRAYPAFRAWAIANGFRKGLQLDRIDGNGNYEPSNCRWIPREDQVLNMKSVHQLTLNGVTKPLPVWAREIALPIHLLRHRKYHGWTDEQILTTPKLRSGHFRVGVEHKPRGRRPREQNDPTNQQENLP